MDYRYICVCCFLGLGLFSYFLIVNYTDFSPQAAELLYSWGALVFTILAFNLMGYFTLWMSGWVNRQYAINASWKRKIGMLYITVIFLFLALNYGLFVTAKILADVESVFNFSRSGWNLLIVVWLAEMVVIGLLLSNRTLQANWLLQQEAAKITNGKCPGQIYCLAEPAESPFSVQQPEYVDCRNQI